MVKIVKISKEEAIRRLGDVPEDKRFWCHDGKVMKNLVELEEALASIEGSNTVCHIAILNGIVHPHRRHYYSVPNFYPAYTA